jgi:hypothetical protein
MKLGLRNGLNVIAMTYLAGTALHKKKQMFSLG